MIKNRLLNNITKNENECWIWNLSKDKNGYGYIKINNKTNKAHRISYEVFIGKIPDGLSVCHTCDNPSCINPNHLFTGMTQDNTKDRDNKNRQAKGDKQGLRIYPESRSFGIKNGMNTKPESRSLGSENGEAKLAEEQVLTIRDHYKSGMFTQQQLADIFNVSQNCISLIIRRKKWKHI